MKEFEKEFYTHLGLLSVKFSKMDYNLSYIVGKLLGNDDDLINITLIEKNTLSQNIELLKKINRIRNYRNSTIVNLITEISKIKNKRKLFIHGIWGKPFVSDNDIKIVCDERRLRYKEVKDNTGYVFKKEWSYNQNHVFRLTYIKKQISKIEDILLSQDFLIKELEDVNFSI